MSKLILMVGPPGSGKSTMALKLIEEEYPEAVYINQDAQGKEQHMELYLQAIVDSKPIIVDRMNFNKEQRSHYLTFAANRQYDTEIRVLHESQDTCFIRCRKRASHETIKTSLDATRAIEFFFKKYERVEDSEAKTVKRFWPKGYKSKAIICDLDGTLCNIEHRLHHVRGEGKKDWASFFKELSKDKVNQWCADILALFSPNHEIVLCTGRGAECLSDTVNWLHNNSIQYHRIFTRALSDHRKDSVVKEIILEFEILTRYKPIFVIDDRKSVVSMWRSHGLVCLACAEGDF